ncbi:flagellar motor protein MotA [Oceaniferula spumae]|uniref:Flagellar motor protein MotA n=1 Tax=Oceaniferula spumae TaxID=2979115 RepID=A0AAT9FQM4_9BACT
MFSLFKSSRALVVLIAASGSLFAQDLTSIEKDLKKAQQELTDQRAAIAAEKPALAKSFDAVRSELVEKRRKARIARMTVADRDALLKELEHKHHLSGQDHSYVDGQLRDYGLKLETFLLPGEEASYQEALDGLHSPNGTPAEKMKKRLASLEAGMDRLEKLIGGSTVKGEAVAPDGTVKDGTFALAGPAAWFAASDDSLAGSIVREKGSRSPKVHPGERGEIKTIIGGGESSVSVDFTGGKALALASLEEDKLDIFRKGGFWIWPILGIALFSAISGIIKFVQIVRIRTPENDWVSKILAALRSGDQEGADNIAAKAYHPASEVIRKCLGYAKAGPDVVEEVLYEQLIGVQSKLQSWLPFIAVTAATAPLLGLLGTVAGMIRTFNVITVSGTGDAKPLAGGISEALITTLFGLVVAIPALIIHALLSRRCQGIATTTEKLGLTLVNGLRSKSTTTDQ